MAQAAPAVPPGTIKAQVSNFRGVTRADIDITGITLIAGGNGMGKTSMLQAVGAAYANAAIPFFRGDKPDSPLLAKKQAGLMMHNNADLGGSRLTTAKGVTQIAWPAMDAKSQGEPVTGSKVAAGLINPLDMPDALRAQFFSQLLQTTPTQEELIAALVDPRQAGLMAKTGEKEHEQNDQPIIDAVCERVDIGGFDGAHKHLSENRTKLKGRWEQATGIRWGDTRTDFKPDGWDEKFADKSDEQYDELIAQAKERVTQATGKAAVDEAAIGEATINAKKEPAAKIVLQEAQRAHEKAREALEEAVAELDRHIVPKTVPCAHCGELNIIKVLPGGDIEVQESQLSAKDIEKIARARAGAENARDKADQALSTAYAALEDAQRSYNTFKDAPAHLERLKAQAAEAGGDKEALLKAQQDVETLTAQQEMCKTKEVADALHARAMLNSKILAVLAPDGLRKTKLATALADFNEMLEGLCTAAGFETIAMNEDLDVTFNKVPHFMCSASEVWRLKVIIQLAVAIKERAPLVIIDSADILDAEGRNGFFSLLHELSKPDTESGNPFAALVAMTMNEFNAAPALQKLGWGISVWMEGGEITETK